MTVMMTWGLGSEFGIPPDMELGRPVAVEALKRWPRVMVEKGFVRVAGEPSEIKVPPHALRAFLELHNTGPGGVREFVREFGPLCLCPAHGLPAGGPDYRHGARTNVTCRYFLVEGCPPLVESLRPPRRLFVPSTTPFTKSMRGSEVTGVVAREPVDAYIRLAGRAFKLFQAAFIMRRGLKPKTDDFPDDDGMLRWVDYEPARWLWEHARWWIWICGLGITMPFEPERVAKVRLGFAVSQPNPLFAAIALQLVAALNGANGLGFCAECGQLYLLRRRPGPRESSYCPECGIKAAWRRASRKHRKALKRKKGKVDGTQTQRG